MMAAEQSNGLEIEVIFNSLIQIDSKTVWNDDWHNV